MKRTGKVKFSPKYRPRKAYRVAMAAIAGMFTMSACQSSDNDPPSRDRPLVTTAECIETGGVVVADPGDGRVHAPDYLCESGLPPIGTIEFLEGEPVAIEGAVCCPQIQ